VSLSATLASRPDAERVRLRLGTAFVEHASDLWPAGDAPDPTWIRDNVDSVLALLELPLRHDGRDMRRLPRRLIWVLGLLRDID